MRLYLKRKSSGVDAIAEYSPSERLFIVLKGSKVSSVIAHTATFRGSKSIEAKRNGTVKSNTVISDVTFHSASTAANYVCGASVNGLVAWKDKDGYSLKELLGKSEEKA